MASAEDRVARLERRVQRERRAREEAERLLEAKALELWEANQDLEARVAERTRELRAAMEAAEAASRAKGMFLASVSHELRTPMNAIIGACALVLERGRLVREDAELLSMVRRSADGLLVIINDVLDLSKLASGTVALRPRPTDVGRLVRDCQRFAAAGHGKPGVTTLVEDRRTEKPLVALDPDRVRQILLNLGSNAMKFTEAGTVRFVVDHRPGPDGPELVVEVTDTGLGIPEEALATIFEPFRRVDESSTRRAGGTGLGLAISQRLAALMGGALEVESEVDRGSTFTFRLPLVRADSPSRDLEPQALRRLAPGLRVLLVEDNPINVAIISEMLDHVGCEVAHAGTGREALDAYRPEAHDLILMDCQMPEMDGLESTRILRARYGAAVPIIALTGNAAESDQQESLDAGMNDHASKPITLDRLREVLARWDPRPHPLDERVEERACRSQGGEPSSPS